jgi:uncharacterized integral membrane protein
MVRFIVFAVLFIALLFVSLDNAGMVTLRLFRLYELQAPLIVVVLCAFAIGAALGLAVGVLRAARVKRELRKLKREIAAREAGNAAVRDAATPFDAM